MPERFEDDGEPSPGLPPIPPSGRISSPSFSVSERGIGLLDLPSRGTATSDGRVRSVGGRGARWAKSGQLEAQELADGRRRWEIGDRGMCLDGLFQILARDGEGRPCAGACRPPARPRRRPGTPGSPRPVGRSPATRARGRTTPKAARARAPMMCGTPGSSRPVVPAGRGSIPGTPGSAVDRRAVQRRRRGRGARPPACCRLDDADPRARCRGHDAVASSAIADS